PNFHLSILNLEVPTSTVLDAVILSSSQVEEEIGKQDGKLNLEPPSSSRVNYTKSRSWHAVTLDEPPRVNHTSSSIYGSEPLGKPARITPSITRNDSFQLGNSVDCSFSEALSDYCDIKGVIRIHGHSSTIFTTNLNGNKSWIIKPYPRKGSGAMKSIREWMIKPVDSRDMPSCTTTHVDPAILFSAGGFSGNLFHDFSDIIIPLFTNSRIFSRRVNLLVTNYKSWWIPKFQKLLNQLSDHQVVDIDNENQIHCYQNMIVGLRSYKELGIDSSRWINGYNMKDFRHFLRSAYSLKRPEVIKLKLKDDRRPRLMIISRKSTRRLLNEASIVKMAQKIGYEVILANLTLTTNLSNIAHIVNSCDVFMGVHGAGLTNMVFLPDHAVVVQVVPLGGLEGIAKTDFGEPSKEMNLRYLKYSIRVKESSLSTQYAKDDVVLRDPIAIHKQGWDALRATYLVKQNVKLDVRRFRSTLIKAFWLLHR
ncbi:O-linked-mannose beta-1,4-N-acetylglucosaminyltransferase 2-like protein, partial [Tanacetum coccineum]